MCGRRGEAFHASLHDQAMDAAFGVLRLRPHHRDIGYGAVAYPHLGTVQQVMVALVLEHGDHAARVAAMIGFGKAKTADHFTGRELGQPFLLLFLATVFPDRVHHQRSLHAAKASKATVTPLDLLHDEAVADLVQPHAAILLRDHGPEGADLRQSGNDLWMEGGVLEGIFNDRLQVLAHELARRIPDQLMFLCQKLIHLVMVMCLIEIGTASFGRVPLGRSCRCGRGAHVGGDGHPDAGWPYVFRAQN